MKRFLISTIFAAASLSCAVASDTSPYDFLTVFLKDGRATRVSLIPTDSVECVRYSRLPGDCSEDGESVPDDGFITLDVLKQGGGYSSFPLDSVIQYAFGTNVPTLRIDTEEFVEEITSKKDYLKATFNADCMGRYDDVRDVAVNIRGRGNSTWSYPKKPYRLKFDKKISLFGLPKAKSYALIANHIDNTQMRNAVAFRVAQLLDMPFTNHSIPVNVVFNGLYKGSYQLTEKIGINGGSVDIDETEGILWEIDTAYDEDFKFESPVYKMKVMVKDPDFFELEEDDSTITAENRFEIWKSDFVRMEKSVVEGNWFEEIDLDSMVDYILVYLFTGNREISWPKSTYLYKERIGEKYKMGPVWDFDWGFNFINPPDRFLLESFYVGMNFFFDVVKTPQFKKAFESRWDYFKANIYPQVMAYIDYYAAMVRVSALQNGELWPLSRNIYTTECFDASVEEMKEWIRKRMDYIDNDPNHGISR